MISGGKRGNGIKSVVRIIRIEELNNVVHVRTNNITAQIQDMA